MKLTPSLRVRSLILGLFLSLVLPCASAADKISVEDFFRKPLVVEPSLSPDGKTLAYALRDTADKDQDDYGLSLLNLETMESTGFKIAGRSTGPDMWLDSRRLVVGSEEGRAIYDLKTRKNHAFNPREGFAILSRRRAQPGLLNVFFHEGDRSLRAGPAVIDPGKNLPSSSGSITERYNVVQWIPVPKGETRVFNPDWHGQFRLACMYVDKTLRYYYRATEADTWTMLPLDAYEDNFIGYPTDPTKLYIVHRGDSDPAAALYLYDVKTHTFGEKIWSDPDFSMTEAALRLSSKDGSLVGITYLKDRQVNHWFDPGLQAVQNEIDAKLPGRDNFISDRDDEDQIFLVASEADRSPPAYYLYHRATKKLSALPDPYPWLRKVELRPTQAIRFKARDGLKLQGYLTLPKPASNGSKPPLVVLAHGGPWVRDTWGYDPEAQFLAHRGYAVFQPNYRGSTGFTHAISTTDKFDFKAMHDDVTDGVKQLIKSGLIDPARIAIMGGSFGGYLAVGGAAFEPGLYKCAVTIVGVFDWEQIVRQTSGRRFDKFNYDILIQKLGDPKLAKEAFDAISPLRHVDDINIPVYISAGEYDPRVDASQSKKLYAELKKRDVPVEQFIAGKEGHGYFESKTRLRLYREIEAFLAKYL